MKRFRYIAWMLVLALAAQGCDLITFSAPNREAEEGAEMSFALSVGRTSETRTRMTDAIVQNTGTTSFRGIERLYVVPFKSVGGVVAGDRRYGPNLELPQVGLPANLFATTAAGGTYTGLVMNNNAHLYASVYIRSGVSSVLTYGKAIDESLGLDATEQAVKARNGSLIPSDLASFFSTDDISFSLDPIADATTVETELESLLGYLNSIAQTSVAYGDGVVRWTASESYNSAELSAALRSFTFEGKTFAGNATVLGQLLTRLYRSVNALSVTGAAESLRSAILSNITNDAFVSLSGGGSSTVVTLRSDFPVKYGLPAGCVTLQWNGSEFWRPTRGSGSSAVSFTSFCYPPSLWYYVNSPLVISRSENLEAEYTASRPTWQSIAALYTDGSVVGNGTTAAAVREPLQYGVSLLDFTLLPTTRDWLADSKGVRIGVNNANFPVTAMIISDQKNLGFDFTPQGDRMFYLYDSEVNDGSQPKTYLAYSGATVSRRNIQILTVETEKQSDVHVALEFVNNSGSDFYGHDGDRILAGSKFYLFGTLKYTDAVNNTSDPLESIFVQDHVTTVSFRVDSLAEAYSTIPDMRDPFLSIGVTADVSWILSTPASIPVK